MKKKLLAAVLSAAMVLTLTACGGAGAPAASGEPAPAAEEAGEQGEGQD